MRFDVEMLIYAYMFICVSLLGFNLLYIASAGGKKRRQVRRTRRWEREIRTQMNADRVSDQHLKKMERKLRRINTLIAYQTALETIQSEGKTQQVETYLLQTGRCFQALAAVYAGRDSMERSYFAWVLAEDRPNWREKHMICEIMMGYLEDSTVYCRENVLRALYGFGSVDAVEQALQFMEDREIFHHPKLLSDGLAGFTGDKQQLAWRLWSHLDAWSAARMVATVQFAMGVSDAFCAPFLQALQRQTLDLEVRLAILRYFRRYVYRPAAPLLRQYAAEHDGEELAIVAASVLERYPGKETMQTLERALCSSNWYVRSNAAVSLIGLEIGQDEIDDIIHGPDRYAGEMLAYQLKQAGKEERA